MKISILNIYARHRVQQLVLASFREQRLNKKGEPTLPCLQYELRLSLLPAKCKYSFFLSSNQSLAQIIITCWKRGRGRKTSDEGEKQEEEEKK